MTNCVKVVDTKDYPHTIVLVNNTPITGYVDEIVKILEKINSEVKKEYDRDLRTCEFQAILGIALYRGNL